MMDVTPHREEVEELISLLTNAIHDGDVERAQDIVVHLASLNLKLNIGIVSDQNEMEDRPFKITIQVEDRESAGASFDLLVRSTDKIGDLKKKVRIHYKFPEEVQRWIIGKKIPEDWQTLARAGVKSPTTVFIYLLPAHSMGLVRTPDDGGQYHDGSDMFDPLADLGRLQNTLGRGLSTTACSKSLSFEDQLPNLMVQPRVSGEEEEEEEEEEEAETDLWDCDKCTYINSENDPACVMCGHLRFNFGVELDDGTGTTHTPDVGLIQTAEHLPQVGERVVWPSDRGPEKGTVRWIGTLSDMEGGPILVGVEFDNPVGTGNGMYKDTRLFYTQLGHASLIPPDALMRDEG